LWNEILEELHEFMQHGYEYSVAAFVTFETKLHIMKSNKLCPVYMYNFYAMWNSDATSTTETKTCLLQEIFWLQTMQ
jgi:hypothetical protein